MFHMYRIETPIRSRREMRPVSKGKKMTRIHTILLAAILLLAAGPARAQRYSVGTNAADWLSLGTMNASASVAVSRRVTLNAEARVNPWTFNTRDAETQLQNRHQTYMAGMRWWPWYVYSGWWLGAAVQYQEYNRGGIFSRSTEEGDAFGAVLSGGYTVMLHERLNLDLGAAGWFGQTAYTVYDCPRCGRISDSGQKWFVLPSEVYLSLIWIF